MTAFVAWAMVIFTGLIIAAIIFLIWVAIDNYKDEIIFNGTAGTITAVFLITAGALVVKFYTWLF